VTLIALDAIVGFARSAAPLASSKSVIGITQIRDRHHRNR